MKDIELVITESEHEDYDMEKEDFLSLVNDEIKEYLPKLKRYANNHTKEECMRKTGDWWDDYRISDSTERTLDKYIEEVLFV